MEFQEEEINYLNKDEREIAKLFTNTGLDIFQEGSGYCVRNLNAKTIFDNSNEHYAIQDNASSLLTSCSNLLYYSIGVGDENIHQSKRRLKEKFYDVNQNVVLNKTHIQIEEEYEEIKTKILITKLKNHPKYIEIDNLLKERNFYTKMRTNRVFYTKIIENPFFRIHPKFREIMRKLGINLTSSNINLGSI